MMMMKLKEKLKSEGEVAIPMNGNGIFGKEGKEVPWKAGEGGR